MLLCGVLNSVMSSHALVSRDIIPNNLFLSSFHIIYVEIYFLRRDILNIIVAAKGIQYSTVVVVPWTYYSTLFPISNKSTDIVLSRTCRLRVYTHARIPNNSYIHTYIHRYYSYTTVRINPGSFSSQGSLPLNHVPRMRLETGHSLTTSRMRLESQYIVLN